MQAMGPESLRLSRNTRVPDLYYQDGPQLHLPRTLFHASLPPEFIAQLPPTRAIKCHQLSLTEFRIYLPARRRLLDLSCRDCDKPNHDFATSSCNSANFKSSLFFFFFFWTKSFSREYSLFLFIVIGKLMSKNNFTILSPREISIRNAAKLELKTGKLDITLLKKYSTFRKIIENGRLTKVAQKFSLTQRFDKLRPAPCYARNTLIRSQTNVHRCNCPGTHDLILRIKQLPIIKAGRYDDLLSYSFHWKCIFNAPVLISRCFHENNLFPSSFFPLLLSVDGNSNPALFKNRLSSIKSTIGIILPDTIIPVVLVAYLHCIRARLIACNRLEKFSSLRSENTVSVHAISALV